MPKCRITANHFVGWLRKNYLPFEECKGRRVASRFLSFYCWNKIQFSADKLSIFRSVVREGINNVWTSSSRVFLGKGNRHLLNYLQTEILFHETSELCSTDNSSANISRNMSRLFPIKAAAEKSQSINSESIRAVYNEKSVVLPQNPNKFFASRPSEHTQHRRVMARMNIVRIQCASRKWNFTCCDFFVLESKVNWGT